MYSGLQTIQAAWLCMACLEANDIGWVPCASRVGVVERECRGPTTQQAGLCLVVPAMEAATLTSLRLYESWQCCPQNENCMQ